MPTLPPGGVTVGTLLREARGVPPLPETRPVREPGGGDPSRGQPRARERSAPGPAHVTGLDAGRVVAALGTIWIHTGLDPDFASSSALGRFAVPFFCILAGFFLVKALQGRWAGRAAGYVATRAGRLYVPFLVWTLIFAGLRLGVEHTIGANFPLELGLQTPLVGTMYHLWFLPFLALATALGAPLVVWALRSPARTRWTGVAFLAAGTALALKVPSFDSGSGLSLWYFIDRSLHRLPGFLWGVGLGLSWGTDLLAYRRRVDRLGVMRLVAPAAVLAACLGYYWAMGRTPIAANLAGLAFAMVCLRLGETGAARRLAVLAPLSFGVYLLHPLFASALHRVMSHYTPTLPDAAQHLIAFAVVAPASVAAVWGLSRTRVGKWLVP